MLELHKQMEERVGRTMDLPELDQRPVIATAVREVNGKITHGIFVEVEAEACAIGSNPLPAFEAKQAENLLLPVLKYYDIRIVRSFVPSQMLAAGKRGRKAPIGRLLESMQFTEDQNMTQFFRWM